MLETAGVTRIGDAPWSGSLNSAQREAVGHRGSALLIVAGAGTGKTGTLACRVAGLLASGVPPQRLLLLTFSRRAAREMLMRVERMAPGQRPGQILGGTFHSVANRLLRQQGRPVGVTPDFTVLDQADAADMLDLIREGQGIDVRSRRFARKETLAAIYSRTVNQQRPVTEVLAQHFPWCADDAPTIGAIFSDYTARKRASNLLDYDDLLLYWLALARSSPAGELMAHQFEHVLVDEYQDTNALQADLLACLHRAGCQLTVVGDDAQAIYSFRAATVDNILTFHERFAPAQVVRLEQNYRGTPPLLDTANALMEQVERSHPTRLWSERPGRSRPVLVRCFDEAEQARALCESVLEAREQGIPLMRQAVLFRTSHHSDLLEVELSRRNIPFIKYGGLKFLEAAHVKDVLALLRVVENPRDEVSWFRVVQLVQGVGPALGRRLVNQMVAFAGDGAAPAATRLETAAGDLRGAVEDEVKGLSQALLACAGEASVAGQIGALREFCTSLFERVYAQADVRLRDLDQLEAMAAPCGTLGEFLSEVALDPPGSTGDLAGPPLLDEDFLILSTIHSAKGGEWDVVRIINATDGMIPSDMSTGDTASIDEERRLLYVAMTRARDRLEIYAPLRYYRRPRGLDDGHGLSQISRFLTREVIGTMEECNTPGAAQMLRGPLLDALPQPSDGGAAVDGMLRNLWA